MRNSPIRFCYLQLTDMSGLSVAKPDRRFETLSLRHAVCTAKKVGSSSSEIRRKRPYFAIILGQTGRQRTDCSAANVVLSSLFSGRHMRSPVSMRALGECNAIRSWRFGHSESTLSVCGKRFGRFPKNPFYEQVDLVKSVFVFPSLWCCFCYGLNARHMWFSTGFLLAL